MSTQAWQQSSVAWVIALTSLMSQSEHSINTIGRQRMSEPLPLLYSLVSPQPVSSACLVALP